MRGNDSLQLLEPQRPLPQSERLSKQFEVHLLQLAGLLPALRRAGATPRKTIQRETPPARKLPPLRRERHCPTSKRDGCSEGYTTAPHARARGSPTSTALQARAGTRHKS